MCVCVCVCYTHIRTVSVYALSVYIVVFLNTCVLAYYYYLWRLSTWSRTIQYQSCISTSVTEFLWLKVIIMRV